MQSKKNIDNLNIRSMVPGDIGHILDIDENLQVYNVLLTKLKL